VTPPLARPRAGRHNWVVPGTCLAPRVCRARARLAVGFAAALGVVAALALPQPAAAGGFWQEALGPARGDSNVAVAMRAADAYAEQAATHSMRNPRRAQRLARDAVESYERAIAIDPEQPEPHYRAAEVLYAHFIRNDNAPDPELAGRAIDHWRRFETLDPLDPRVPDLLIRRSLTHTKITDRENLEHALEDYRRLSRLIDGRSSSAEGMATRLSNKAEILMMLGRMTDSIELYARSLGYQDRPLYGYGLAVALDRDGQGVKAREVMRAYASSDELRDLTRPDVFFVPDGELDYYLGLGHDALGNPEQAMRHFERFLDSGAHPQFHERAREHLAQLRRALGGGRVGQRR
jgi:tetratricopeptide (TPR) repeat protein